MPASPPATPTTCRQRRPQQSDPSGAASRRGTPMRARPATVPHSGWLSRLPRPPGRGKHVQIKEAGAGSDTRAAGLCAGSDVLGGVRVVDKAATGGAHRLPSRWPTASAGRHEAGPSTSPDGWPRRPRSPAHPRRSSHRRQPQRRRTPQHPQPLRRPGRTQCMTRPSARSSPLAAATSTASLCQ